MKKIFDVEKKSQVWLGLLVLVSSIIYILASLGRADWTVWMALVFGVFLSGFLIFEGGVYHYWKSKGYKHIGMSDFVVYLTMFVAGAVFLNSIALMGVVRDWLPDAVLSFLSTIGVTTGIIAGILGIIYVLIPKPKA